MFFWSEEVLDTWYWSSFCSNAKHVGIFVGFIFVILFLCCHWTKKDDRLAILFIYLVVIERSAYEFTLGFPAPGNLITPLISIIGGYWAFCSKKMKAEWDKKERQGIISSHKAVYEKQREEFSKLPVEEQERRYAAYLETAPPRITLKSILLFHLIAYGLSEGVKLAYYLSL